MGWYILGGNPSHLPVAQKKKHPWLCVWKNVMLKECDDKEFRVYGILYEYRTQSGIHVRRILPEYMSSANIGCWASKCVAL